jgi:hypothetical protein
MPPIIILAVVCALTAAALMADSLRRGRIQCVLRRLAVEQRMHFSAYDQLRLAPRVASGLDVPGAAAVGIVDLLYCSEDGQYRYIFTVEYTTGVVQSKRRIRRAAAFSEPRERSATVPPCAIRMAPLELSLLEQYRWLIQSPPPPGLTSDSE